MTISSALDGSGSFSADPLRIMILCAGHPDLEDTRAASAAMTLFRRLQPRPDVEPVLVSARRFASLADASGVTIHRGRRDEFVASVPAVNPRTLCSRNVAERDLVLADLLDHHGPDVVHLVGVEGVGIDVVDLLAERGLPIVLTLMRDLAPPDGEGPVDYKADFIRMRLFGSYLARAGQIVATDPLLADKLLDVFGLPSLQLVVGPNKTSGQSDVHPVVPTEGPRLGEDGTFDGLLKARRAKQPIRLGVVLSSNVGADLAFLHEAIAHLPIGYRRRFAISVYADAARLRRGAAAGASGGREGVAELQEGGLVGGDSDIQVEPIDDLASLRKMIGSQDRLLVFSRSETLPLEAAAEAISLDVPFLYPSRSESGSSDALGATVFDPDAPSHLAHCLLSLAKTSSRLQRAVQRTAREIENDEAVEIYANFYRQLFDAHSETGRRGS